MTSRMTKFSKITVRNLQLSPSMTSRMVGSRHTSNHARAEILQTSKESHIMTIYKYKVNADVGKG